MKGSRAHGCASKKRQLGTLAGGQQVLGGSHTELCPRPPSERLARGERGTGVSEHQLPPPSWAQAGSQGILCRSGSPRGGGQPGGRPTDPQTRQVPVPAAATSVAACPLLCSRQQAGSVVGVEPCLECAQDQRFQTSEGGWAVLHQGGQAPTRGEQSTPTSGAAHELLVTQKAGRRGAQDTSAAVILGEERQGKLG
ncbi:unnamed protein product [Rangifer tarandus platyrhynchus]|uniref:Uncharacterized protein n=1 Tax=Rangifer tarandus platyrhynchus TaxID=3082113 RepID=A0AC59Y4E5_RANTA